MPYRDGDKWVGQVRMGTKGNFEFKKRKSGFPTKTAAGKWEVGKTNQGRVSKSPERGAGCIVDFARKFGIH